MRHHTLVDVFPHQAALKQSAAECSRLLQHVPQLQDQEECHKARHRLLDAKVCSAERSQLELDRRLTEVRGTCSALSTELRSHANWADLRTSELQASLEEELRELRDKFDESLRKQGRACNAVIDESLKQQSQRLNKLEAALQHHAGRHEEARRAILDLDERIVLVEARDVDAAVAALLPQVLRIDGVAARPASIDTVNQRLAELEEAMQRISRESCNTQTRIEAHEGRSEFELARLRHFEPSHSGARDFGRARLPCSPEPCTSFDSLLERLTDVEGVARDTQTRLEAQEVRSELHFASAQVCAGDFFPAFARQLGRLRNVLDGRSVDAGAAQRHGTVTPEEGADAAMTLPGETLDDTASCLSSKGIPARQGADDSTADDGTVLFERLCAEHSSIDFQWEGDRVNNSAGEADRSELESKMTSLSDTSDGMHSSRARSEFQPTADHLLSVCVSVTASALREYRLRRNRPASDIQGSHTPRMVE